jgi:hypothetical protein
VFCINTYIHLWQCFALIVLCVWDRYCSQWGRSLGLTSWRTNTTIWHDQCRSFRGVLGETFATFFKNPIYFMHCAICDNHNLNTHIFIVFLENTCSHEFWNLRTLTTLREYYTVRKATNFWVRRIFTWLNLVTIRFWNFWRKDYISSGCGICSLMKTFGDLTIFIFCITSKKKKGLLKNLRSNEIPATRIIRLHLFLYFHLQ